MDRFFRSGLMTSAAAIVFSASVFITAINNPLQAKDDKGSVKDYTIIKVGDDSLKNSEVIKVWEGLFAEGKAPDFNKFDEKMRQNILRGLITERLIYKEAEKAGFENDESVKKRVDALRRQLVMQVFMEDKSKSMVTDAEIKKAYDAKVNESKGKEEVKAKHILVDSEEEANKIYDSLKKGGDFDKIAKEKSADKGTGVNGGDLGWFAQDKMVPEFSNAAFKLKKGEISKPVKSAFGWHIIKLEDRRPLKIASFEESKPVLEAQIKNDKLKQYVEGLLKKASIKYFDENGKEKKFDLSLPDNAKK
ncbi:MAG: peptidylprolyl isomerase [Rickettsiales bacterium]